MAWLPAVSTPMLEEAGQETSDALSSAVLTLAHEPTNQHEPKQANYCSAPHENGA